MQTGRRYGAAQTSPQAFPVCVRGPDDHMGRPYPRRAVQSIEQALRQIALVGETAEKQETSAVVVRRSARPRLAETRSQERIAGADKLVARRDAGRHVTGLDTLIDEDVAVMDGIGAVLDHRYAGCDAAAGAVERPIASIVIDDYRMACSTDLPRDLLDLVCAVRAEPNYPIERFECPRCRLDSCVPGRAERAPALLGESRCERARAHRVTATDRRRGVESEDRRGLRCHCRSASIRAASRRSSSVSISSERVRGITYPNMGPAV